MKTIRCGLLFLLIFFFPIMLKTGSVTISWNPVCTDTVQINYIGAVDSAPQNRRYEFRLGQVQVPWDAATTNPVTLTLESSCGQRLTFYRVTYMPVLLR